VQLIALKRYPEARAAIHEFVDRFPQDATMRKAMQMTEKAQDSK
jgi:TolA-binding protein